MRRVSARGTAAAAESESGESPAKSWRASFQEMATACQWARQAQVPNFVLRLPHWQGPQFSLACQLRRLAGPARGPWTNLGRLPLRVFSIGKYMLSKKNWIAKS